MRLISVLLLAPIILAGCAAPLVVDASKASSARAAAAALTSQIAPESRIMSAEFSVEEDAAGNFGIIWKFKSTLSSSRDGDGIHREIATETRTTGAGPTREIKASTLCGLVALESGYQRVSSAGSVSFMPIAGGALVPVNADSLAYPSSKVVATTFESTTPAICSPSLGTTLQFKIAGASESAVTGMAGTMRFNNPFVEEATCTTEPLPEKLSYLKSVGANLIAKCVHTGQQKPHRLALSEHVFIPKAGRFLPLRLESSPRTVRTFEYTNIAFSK